MEYTDGKFIYYVSPLLGEHKYAVCKKECGKKTYGNHKYRSSSNKTVKTPGEAQDYLDRLAQRKKWEAVS